MSNLEQIDDLKILSVRFLASKKKFLKLSAARREMTTDTHTLKRIDKANVDLDWHAMEHDKIKRDLHAVAVDCGIAEPRDIESYREVEYNPSGWHKFTHQPRVPLCRQVAQ